MTENNKKIKLVTVHGTWAGTPNEENPHWWQTTSAFSQTLKNLLSKQQMDVDVIPFVWSGENSSYHRSKAAKALQKQLKKHHKNGNDVHLIGHSHGGSVIEEALERMRWKAGTESTIKTISTVGTPFFQRTTSKIRKIAVALTLILLCLVLLMFVANLKNQAGNSDYLILGVLIVPGLYFLYHYLPEILPPARVKGSVYWQAIWHPNDEAISALRQVEHQNVDGFSASSIKKTINYFFENMLMLSVLSIGAGLLLLTVNKQILTAALIIFMNLPFLWIVAALLLIFIAKPLAQRLNKKIAATLKGLAFGQDSPKQLHNVQPLPHLYKAKAVSLSPETLHKMLSGAQQKLASFIIANHEAMTLIHSTKAHSEGLSRTLIELDGGELVHTTYFDQHEVAQLVSSYITNPDKGH